MKEQLAKIIGEHLQRLGLTPPENLVVEEPKAKEHGDLATNVALVLAKAAGKPPRDLAADLAASLEQESGLIEKIEVKGPGFINFFLKESAFQSGLASLWQGKSLAMPTVGKGVKVLIEFVSANPTGPMHVGHGRNAVVGDTLARLLQAVGYAVTREFYVNDHGVQIQTLGRSGGHYHQILTQVAGVTAALPDDVYQGEHLEELVKNFADEIAPIHEDPLAVGKFLGIHLLEAIKKDLADLQVYFDHYFSESSLYSTGQIDDTLEALKQLGHTYSHEGALWFRSTDFGDDKDRVLIKQDNSYTYFTPDIAYHRDKFSRNFDRYINVMGADHGGYVGRMKAAVQALGFDSEKLEFVLMQMVSLLRKGERVAMSKRSGDYVTLREVVDEVGKDAARFFLLLRSHNTHLDFDLELAKEKSNDNPVYYVQYAHARMCSIFRKAKEEGGYPGPEALEPEALDNLNLPEEIQLIKLLLAYSDTLVQAADLREPHRIIFYLLDLAKTFQNYYTQGKTDARYRVIGPDRETTLAKLFLVKSLQAVFASGLEILGVSAPKSM